MFFPLHPETPLQGQSLESLFAGRHLDLAAMHDRLATVMRAEGLAYGERTHTYNSRLAQEFGKWAETQTGGDDAALSRVHEALYRAYFVEGRNIGLVDELVAIAESLGLSSTSAREILTTRQLKEAVDADWVYARRAGVTSVPTFVVGQRGVVGAQPYDVLERLVVEGGAVPR